MKLIAVDPGQKHSAFVLWNTNKHKFIGAKHGIFENEYMLEIIGKICSLNKIESAAIEMMQSYHFNVGRSVFETILFIGRLIEKLHPIPYKLYCRSAIKGQIGGCKDSEIRRSLVLRYGESRKGHFLEGVKKDIWAAFALAVALEEKPNLKEW